MQSKRSIVFEIYDSRSQKAASHFLQGITGILLTDGYCVYKNLPQIQHGTLLHAHDWAHPRRKFLAAEKNFPIEAGFFISQIDSLFLIERQIKDLPLDERLKIRQLHSQSFTQAIYDKLLELKNSLPQSSLGKAIHYCLSLWPGLTVFLTQPHVPLDSNSIEREMRPPVLGRNNHLGSHSLATAQVASLWYSLVASCKLNAVDPQHYLETILPLILQKKNYPMPWDFKIKPVTLVHSPLEPLCIVHPHFP
jgi:transposase